MSITVRLTGDQEDLGKGLFPLHRQLESFYRDLGWPAGVKRIGVLTQIMGGRGDFTAAAKMIEVVQEIASGCEIDWILQGGLAYNPASFLKNKNPQKIFIREWGQPPIDSSPLDLLLVGPVRLQWDKKYIAEKIQRAVTGPLFGIMELGSKLQGKHWEIIHMICTQGDPSFPSIYPLLVPSAANVTSGLLPMGLLEGTGLFLSKERLEAQLSRGDSCPTYLAKISDPTLRQAILDAVPNYDQASFNFGYAHQVVSWGKFIDVVCLHEKDRQVVIVLNQHGDFANGGQKLSDQEFSSTVFDEARLQFLKQQGFGKIVIKGVETIEHTLSSQGRSLTMIIRPSFTPEDVFCLQLAAERILATGDNSAIEAFCSRCSLYVYEALRHKREFFKQQQALAEDVSPTLARLLRLFAENSDQRSELANLLNDPLLKTHTLQFCQMISSRFSFQERLQAALKRVVWQAVRPDLKELEEQSFEPAFKTDLLTYLKNPKPTILQATLAPNLRDRIRDRGYQLGT